MIEGVIFTALKALVGNRCYPNTFLQPESGLPTWPAIRYTITGSTSEVDICGTDSVDTDDTRVQLDIVAKTNGAAIVVRDQVIAAMMGLDPPAVRDGGGFQTFDDETKTHRIVLEYLFCASSAAGSP
ncbi:MAG: DUF3168 domain-containing protein [Betaproteobacteria bacterium]